MSTELRSVITGGGSGLGRALALEIARRGGRVVVADIDEAGAAETARLVEREGSQAHVVRCDVSEAEQVDELAARATELLGAVDLVANNAGVAVGGKFEQTSLESWQWIVNINLWGVIHGCRAFLPGMRQRGHGYVINVASAAGLLCMPTMSAYNVTKAGVVALSETLHVEYKRHGVHVSVLCPTFFTTNLVSTGRDESTAGMRSMIERQMQRSKVQAPEVARAALDGVLDGELYVLPMRDGRMLWRMKRTLPQQFYAWLSGPRSPFRRLLD